MTTAQIRDKRDRPLRDLRISVTDRCNFRCGYCMPAERVYRFKPRRELLTFEEIHVVATLFAQFGVRKLRLTGGEPLLRRDLPTLVEMLAKIDGIEDLALTTNGALLADLAQPLRAAGLNRVTVSIDSLNPDRFEAMSGGRGQLQQTLRGLEAAENAGLGLKINCVVQRGVNDDELIDIATYFKQRGHTLRFIEFMDVGNLNAWQSTKVVPAQEIRTRLSQHLSFSAAPAEASGETALRYRYHDGGEFGIIASVTQPFCGACNRARLSAEGQLYTCLFASKGHDLRHMLREGKGTAEIVAALERIWGNRDDRYSEIRDELRQQHQRDKVEMFHIGG